VFSSLALFLRYGVASYRPGDGETICPPRRWQFDSRRIYVRPRTGPQSAHLWWPALAKLQAASAELSMGPFFVTESNQTNHHTDPTHYKWKNLDPTRYN